MLVQLDRLEFIQAIENEFSSHGYRDHWELCPHSEVNEGMKTTRSIWAFKRKRLPSGEMLKHKARIYDCGRKQQWGINYGKKCSRYKLNLGVITLSHVHGLEPILIYFFLDFPQAALDKKVYMEVPHGLIELLMERSMFKTKTQHLWT